MKEELKQNLQAVITSMINQDSEAATTHLREYLNAKTTAIINEEDDEECDDEMEGDDDKKPEGDDEEDGDNKEDKKDE